MTDALDKVLAWARREYAQATSMRRTVLGGVVEKLELVQARLAELSAESDMIARAKQLLEAMRSAAILKDSEIIGWISESGDVQLPEMRARAIAARIATLSEERDAARAEAERLREAAQAVVAARYTPQPDHSQHSQIMEAIGQLGDVLAAEPALAGGRDDA